MANVTRYVKTEKGSTEIENRGKNLRGRMRTMLFLIDASRTADELRAQAAQIGLDANFLDVLINEGYVVPIVQKATSRVATGVAPAAASTRSTVADVPVADAVPPVEDEASRFRVAKAFINDTVVDALHPFRAFMFTLKLERCATRADLAELLPDYAAAIGKYHDENTAKVLVDHAKDLVAA
jgi:hypothetical protein